MSSLQSRRPFSASHWHHALAARPGRGVHRSSERSGAQGFGHVASRCCTRAGGTGIPEGASWSGGSESGAHSTSKASLHRARPRMPQRARSNTARRVVAVRRQIKVPSGAARLHPGIVCGPATLKETHRNSLYTVGPWLRRSPPSTKWRFFYRHRTTHCFCCRTFFFLTPMAPRQSPIVLSRLHFCLTSRLPHPVVSEF